MPFLSRSVLFLFSATALATLVRAVPDPTPVVSYSPPVQLIEGNQPLVAGSAQQAGINPYTLTITSPSILPEGSFWPQTINLTVEILVDAALGPRVPPGVSLADALGFVTLSKTSVTFAGPNQNADTVVSVNVPSGEYAGNYAWQIRGTNWPAGVSDPKATINATVLPPVVVDTALPVIVNLLPAHGTVFIYNPPTTGPISFPISFDATVAAGGSPISSLSAMIDGYPFNGVMRYPNGDRLAKLDVSGINTLAASGSVQSPNITDPGPHRIVVSATNNVGTTTAETQINIHSPPKITSAPTTTFAFGQFGTFTVTSTGFPEPAYAITAGSLPPGVTFSPTTGALSGTPASATGSPIALTITATNSVGTASQNFALIIAKGNPVLTWENPAAITYGTALTQSIGLADTQLNATANVPGTFIYTPASGATLTAGSHPLSVTFTPTDSNNYNSASKTVTQVVKPAPLVITAGSVSKVYGASLPGFSATYSGFVPGEGPSALGGALAFTSAGSGSSNVGNYAITPGGLTSSNYAITYVNGTLTVTPAPLVVTAESKTKVYGAALPAFTATYSGFVLGQTSSVLGGTLGFASDANVSSPVGNYAITPGGLTSPNYAITYVNGTLTVTPAPLIIRANDKTMVQGAAVPTLDASYLVLRNNDTPSVVTGLSIQTAATSASPVGSYPITISGGEARNYTIERQNGTLIIEDATNTNVTISGVVFLDVSNHGTRDAREVGLGRITVRLYRGVTLIDSIRTAADGSFSFNVAPDAYVVDAAEPAGLTPTDSDVRTVSPTIGWTIRPIGLGFIFKAIQGMKANGLTIGYWKNNIDKAIEGKTAGTQVSAIKINEYTDGIRGLALAPFSDLTNQIASSTMGSSSSAPVDLLKKQLLGSEYNYASGGHINSDEILTYVFITWGEAIADNPLAYTSAEILFTKDWFDAYNNSHGGLVKGPKP